MEEMQRVRVEWKLTGIRQTLYKQQTNNKHTTDRQQADKRQTGDGQETDRRQADKRGVEIDRQHRWRIRLASGSKQAARATPTARYACFVPHPTDLDFTQLTTFHSRPQKRAPPKTLYIKDINN